MKINILELLSKCDQVKLSTFERVFLIKLMAELKKGKDEDLLMHHLKSKLEGEDKSIKPFASALSAIVYATTESKLTRFAVYVYDTKEQRQAFIDSVLMLSSCLHKLNVTISFSGNNEICISNGADLYAFICFKPACSGIEFFAGFMGDVLFLLESAIREHEDKMHLINDTYLVGGEGRDFKIEL